MDTIPAMDTTTTALALSGMAVCLLWVKSKWDKRGMPPGPPGLPILGNALQMDKHRPQLTLTEWGNKYGPVFRIQMMRTGVVVAHTYEAIREVLITNSNDFGGRPLSFRMDYLNHFDHDNFSFGDLSDRFMRLKKKTLTSMKMYGDGLQKLEEISMEFIGDLMEEIKAHNGKPFDPRLPLKGATTNIIASMLLGEKMDPAEIRNFLEWEPRGKGLLNPVGKGMELDILPWLRFFPNETFRKLQIQRKAYSSIFQKWLNRRETTVKQYDEYDEAECVIDRLLKAKYNKDRDGDGKPLFNDSNMLVILQDLIIAGMATTSTAMYTLLAILVTQPKIQRRMQEEIDDVIGGRKPTMADRSDMPYCEAVMLEVLRYLSHLPLALPHKAVRDTTLQGYRVPKGTLVWVNLWHLHHDESFWESPYEFRPEHFLDEEGNIVPPDHQARKRHMAFGAGRRVCMGEVLAKNRIFLFITSMLQEFNFVPVEGSPIPAYDPRDFPLRFILQAPDYQVRAVERHPEE